jgi:hypothetical protein
MLPAVLGNTDGKSIALVRLQMSGSETIANVPCVVEVGMASVHWWKKEETGTLGKNKGG